MYTCLFIYLISGVSLVYFEEGYCTYTMASIIVDGGGKTAPGGNCMLLYRYSKILNCKLLTAIINCCGETNNVQFQNIQKVLV